MELKKDNTVRIINSKLVTYGMVGYVVAVNKKNNTLDLVIPMTIKIKDVKKHESD